MASTGSYWIDFDPKNKKPYRQVELRRASERGYYYHVIWLEPSVKKGDSHWLGGYNWFVAELFGIRELDTTTLRG